LISQGLPPDQTYVFTQCNSGHFCNALAAQGTVILTSTTKDEVNRKAFAEPIRDALNMTSGADANGDGTSSYGVLPTGGHGTLALSRYLK
jgi:hypothetical protein